MELFTNRIDPWAKNEKWTDPFSFAGKVWAVSAPYIARIDILEADYSYRIEHERLDWLMMVFRQDNYMQEVKVDWREFDQFGLGLEFNYFGENSICPNCSGKSMPPFFKPYSLHRSCPECEGTGFHSRKMEVNTGRLFLGYAQIVQCLDMYFTMQYFYRLSYLQAFTSEALLLVYRPESIMECAVFRIGVFEIALAQYDLDYSEREKVKIIIK